MSPNGNGNVKSISRNLLQLYKRPDVILERGDGSFVFDVKGIRYLDMNAGIAVSALGHNHPLVVQAIKDQASVMIHSSNLYHNAHAGTLATNLVQKLGCDTPTCPGVAKCSSCSDKGRLGPNALVFFCNSGTEANEAAIKFSRKIGKALDPSGSKHEIVSFSSAFHGRTMASLSATPSPKYQDPFRPLLPGFKNAPFNNVEKSLHAINKDTCAVIVEPIQGEGGINVGTKEFLAALRKKCDQVGALLIFDEIQCGIGRTGKLYAYQWFGVTPDILTIAKPLANGIPIGAVILSPNVSSHITFGDHGTTFGGNPLATHVGNCVLDVVSDPKFLSNVEYLGNHLIQSLLQIKSPLIKEIRGKGLMVGMELVEDAQATDFVEKCRELGVLVITAGVNTVRLVPALNISKSQLDDAIKVFNAVLVEMESN